LVDGVAQKQFADEHMSSIWQMCSWVSSQPHAVGTTVDLLMNHRNNGYSK